MRRPLRFKHVPPDRGMRNLHKLRDDLRIAIARLEGKLDGIETAIALIVPTPNQEGGDRDHG